MTVKEIFASVLLISLPAIAPLLQAAEACSGPEYRQFDFWVGDCRVLRPDGSPAGVNHVTLEYGGCVVHEHYSNGKGYSGESLNIYDGSRQLWHQTWVDTSGLLLMLEGNFDGSSMVLEGRKTGKEGGVTKHRITWTPDLDGTVRQLWEATDAQGAWTVVFDGRYVRE